jgi:hydroxymethylbilane synthase
VLQTLRIGSRGSKLALWQAHWVAGRLMERFPGLSITIETIKTTGDRIQDVPLAKIGDKGLFTKELDRALLDGRVDLVVHSLKDVPTAPVDGIVLAAVPEREDPRDALIGRDGQRFGDLPPGACVATGSLRRRAQIQALRPDIQLTDLRGNIDTRLRTLKESKNLHGIILALAGVKRLGLAHEVTEVLEPPVWLSAPGQGALGIATRPDEVQDLARHLDHAVTRCAVAAERAVLARLEGGCHVPMGAYAFIENGALTVYAFVADLSGSRMVRHHRCGNADHAEQLGTETGDFLLAHGGAEILRELRIQE